MNEDLNPRAAERLARAARAAQALSETLWEALHEELAASQARRVAELSERLADVAATVVLLARANTDGEGCTGGGEEESEGEDAPFERDSAGPPTAATRMEAHTGRRTEEDPTIERPISAAVLVDEREPAAPPIAPERAPGELEIAIRDEREEHRRERTAETEREEEREEDGTGREEEGREERTPWIAAIARRLERYEHDHAPFAALLIELADVERLRHAELPGEVARLTGLLETMLAQELRPADSLTRESPGRYWLLAPETDSDSARALAARLGAAVRTKIDHRGAPLELAVGVAVCPADGSRAAALAAHAEVGMYAARAAGRTLA